MGLFTAVAHGLKPPADPYTDNPVGWVTDRLDGQLWTKQQQILESVRDHRRTVVYACHGSGKSYVAAQAVAHWLATHPPGSAFVVSTAPNAQQVKAILWREIGKAHRKGHLVGRVNQTEWHIGDEIVGYGRKPSDTDEEGFQGIHAQFVLVVVDEAAGIPEALWTGVLALLTTADCRVLAIGNPDYEGSHFSKMCTPGSGWNVIHIDGLETPNFTGETVPSGAPLLDQTWVDDLVLDYGAESPQYLAKVRGLFPADRTDGCVPWSWAHACMEPAILAPLGDLRVPVELGVDVGGGGDLTVIREKNGPVAGRRWSVNTDDSEKIVDAIIQAVNICEARAIKIDFQGVGFGVTGSLKRRLASEASRPVVVHSVQFGGRAKDHRKFVNARAEMWWEARVRCQFRQWSLGGMDDRTMSDLCEPNWFEAKDGRIQIEDKDEIRKRLGRSPDDGDALVLAFYDPPQDADLEVSVSSYRSTALRGTR